MLKQSHLQIVLAVSLAMPTLSGCGILTTGTNTTEAAKVAEAIGHVRPSRHDTCETQRAIAKQSSRIDSIIKGKEVAYKARPCKDQPRSASNEPKTS